MEGGQCGFHRCGLSGPHAFSSNSCQHCAAALLQRTAQAHRVIMEVVAYIGAMMVLALKLISAGVSYQDGRKKDEVWRVPFTPARCNPVRHSSAHCVRLMQFAAYI